MRKFAVCVTVILCAVAAWSTPPGQYRVKLRPEGAASSSPLAVLKIHFSEVLGLVEWFVIEF